MKHIHIKNLIFVCSLLICLNSYGQNSNEAPLAENAPTDKPYSFNGTDQLEEYDALIAPYVEKAQKTLKKAKKKYLKGLKDGQAFFLTTRIYDNLGNYEQIFVRVSSWKKENVSGTIANQLNAVRGFSFGQTITFPESDILDWLITNPDGSEEGNFVGKYLDTLR
ncbi:MAG: hypothetical protein COA38_08905 [Fluviicola sp.]|nr:MAG: hypothetical protein COA38_08905 [Fluviicola sp.]